jgi:dihydroorotate dehydrogenase electron transfer subunit
MGPIGRGFEPSPDSSNLLLIGGGVGIPPMIFLAESLLQQRHKGSPLVLMGSELPFPCDLRPSELKCDWLPPGINTAMTLLDDRGIASRMASLSNFDGCLRGYVTDLALRWLSARTPEELLTTEIFSCGPTPMLQAVAALARRFGVPCQVSLEEFMACAVGGCAGCTVLVDAGAGPAMKRVCVDGPVFEAAQVFPA